MILIIEIRQEQTEVGNYNNNKEIVMPEQI